MDYTEFVGWIKYFEERPYGWRDDHRAAILTQTTYQGKKKLNIDELFPALNRFKSSITSKKNAAKSFIDILQTKTNNKVIDTKIDKE